METVLNHLQNHTVSLYVVAAFIICAGLLSYTNRRIAVLHRWEKQVRPHHTGRFNSLYNLFFLSYAGGILSFVVLARWSSLTGLAATLLVAAILFSGLNRLIALTLGNVFRQIRGWQWSAPLRSVRVGLLGAGGFGLTFFAEEECLISSLMLTGDPSSVTSAPVLLSVLGQVVSGPLLNGLVVLTLFILGSAFCRATVHLQAQPQLPGDESFYSWRKDSLLLTYLTLLILQFGLAALIAFSAISVYTFWIGYAGVAIGQLTPAGRRGSESLLEGMMSFLRSDNRTV